MGRYTKIAASAAFDRSISAEAFRVLAALGTYADAGGVCFPSVSTIAARLGLSRRQIQRHLRAIEAAGYLITETRKRTDGMGGFGSNVYRVFTEGDASSDDAMLPENTPSDDGHGVTGRQAMRHPTAGMASSEGTIIASSGDALMYPLKEPTTKAPKVKGVASAPPTDKATRGSRLPDDWTPGEVGAAFARELGLDPNRVFASFRDFWLGAAGAKGVKADWPATWRNWCRKEAERRPGGAQGRPDRSSVLIAAVRNVNAAIDRRAGRERQPLSDADFPEFRS
ncbi:MAG: helix-turn-helix domain-containing protein [Rhodospirillaceae bacterium]|nr:helix-turn-helix domain-containing protein [Rhodospirillaceae bacterium]